MTRVMFYFRGYINTIYARRLFLRLRVLTHPFGGGGVVGAGVVGAGVVGVCVVGTGVVGAAVVGVGVVGAGVVGDDVLF